MAKTISDEVMKLSIEINGNKAQTELLDLEKKTRTLTEANKGHLLQKQLLEKQGKKDTEQYKLLTATMKANSAEIVSNKAKMKELQDQIGLTGLTMSQLQSKSTMLRNTLRNLVPGSADYKRYEAELQQVSARMSELKGKATQTKMSLSSMADGFNRYQGMALSIVAAFTGVVLSIQKIIDINGKLSGAQSNVMKTTGMTRQEVDELTKSFGLLETRTSRINLLGIAEQGGRIGIPKEEILDFVNVMNKASVALGDSFTGGAEEVANKLGKIKFLFAETKDLGIEQTYNSIGSAINDLGANGVASEANIADFTTRIGSLTDALKPTIQETLALGAAFEESGIESEVSARAYGIFMNRASTGAGDFAKVMGISKKAVEDMINTNPLEFMLKFSEGMKGMDATDVAKTLDFLKINADGANKVIGAMGNNTARFRELIDLSNQSFADGTSLINEYNIKNNDLEAILERISKTVSGWFSSETFVKWLTVAVTWFANFIGATEEAERKISTWKITLAFTAKLLAVLVSSLVSFTIASKIAALEVKSLGVATAWANLQSKIQVMWTALQIAGLTIYTGVMNYFGFATTRATASLIALNVAGAASPWGALFAVVGAITAAYFAFRDSVDEAAVSQDSFSKQQKVLADEIGKSTAATKAHIAALVNVINNENVSLATRKKAYENLVKIAPEFNGLIVKEGEKVSGLLTIYGDYIKALDQVAYAKGMAKLNEKNIEKEISDSQKLYNAEVKLEQSRKVFEDYRNKTTIKNRDLSKDMSLAGEYSADKIAFEKAKSNLENTKKIAIQTTKFQENTVNNLEINIRSREKQLSDLEIKYGKEVAAKSSGYNQIALKLKADRQSLNALIGSAATGVTPQSNYKVPEDNGDKKADKAAKKQADLAKKQLEDTEKFIEEKLKLERQAEDISLDKMNDGAKKEIIIEQVLLERKLEDLEKALKKEEDIKQAFANASNKNLTETERSYWKAQAELWEASNKTKSSEIEQAVYIHNLKLATIEEKGATEILNKKKETFEREKQQREIKYNEELAALGDNKRAKAKLTKHYEANELVEQEQYLRDLISKFNEIVSKGEFQGIDMSLLTPEQVESFKKLAADAGLALSALSKEKAKLKGEASAENRESLGLGKMGEADIFGFTPDNWNNLFDNLNNTKIGFDEIQFAVTALTNAFSMYSQFVEVNEKKQIATFEKNTNTKKTRYKQQLDSGRISQEQYNNYVEKADADLAKKKAEIENKQAKRQKAITIANIAMNTAQAIMGIWAQFPKVDFGITAGIMTGVVSALGLAQIAMVAKQPLPSASGYEEGLYPEYVKREQDGKMFKSKPAGKTRSGLVTNTSHFLVAENGPEMVIDNKAWTRMNPAVKDALIRDLQGIKGWENGYYNEQLKRYEVPAGSASTPPPSNSTDSDLLMMVLSVLQDNTDVMREIKEYGIEAYMTNKDFKSIENIREGLKKYDALKKSNNV